ncbi:hypothetical protein KKF34_07235 [Myxococcota bacterium]|nr:hypothetical protein [Myxococcota bacterium]MBU1496654.1 hypothetical protein [Myxococcota bacterium]
MGFGTKVFFAESIKAVLKVRNFQCPSRKIGMRIYFIHGKKEKIHRKNDFSNAKYVPNELKYNSDGVKERKNGLR